MQNSFLITALPFRTRIACVGHRLIQLIHPLHKSSSKRTDFVNCLAWNKTAEFVTKYFAKGKMIIVIGRITTRSWETQDGKRAYATEVVANEVNFGESKTSPQLNTPQTAAQPPMQDDDDDFTPLDEDDDDLPF